MNRVAEEGIKRIPVSVSHVASVVSGIDQTKRPMMRNRSRAPHSARYHLADFNLRDIRRPMPIRRRSTSACPHRMSAGYDTAQTFFTTHAPRSMRSRIRATQVAVASVAVGAAPSLSLSPYRAAIRGHLRPATPVEQYRAQQEAT